MEKQKKQITVENTLTVKPPVVTILGHVDHGKTTLLDYIRQTKVAEKEHGGITQHIGAYQIELQGKKITFIDTPGHEAFSQMRRRGGKVADIAVLVVAADDGVMPQTKESISHIKAAQTPLIVAINKTDILGISVEKVKKQLAENGVSVEGYGGDVVAVNISARTGQGVDELLEMILLTSELIELKTNLKVALKAIVIESRLDKYRGPIATLLIKDGILKLGETIYGQTSFGKVRTMVDSNNKLVREALPSTPVEVSGLEKVPEVGDMFTTVESKAVAVEAEKKKVDLLKSMEQAPKGVINLILKADAAGSLEAIEASIYELSSEKQSINIIHKGTGDITESDVLLAVPTKSIVIGFNVEIMPSTQKLADEESVMIRRFNLIYELLDELREGIADVEHKRKVKATAVILARFETKQRQVLGVRVKSGVLEENDKITVCRNKKPIGEGKVISIKQKAEAVKSVSKGEECGIMLDTNVDFQEGDTIEAT